MVAESRSPRVHIELDGEYDIARRQEVATAFAAVPAGTQELVLHMESVTYVDSAFLHELATLRNRLDGSRVTLIAPHPQLKRLLRLVAFDRLFRVVDTA